MKHLKSLSVLFSLKRKKTTTTNQPTRQIKKTLPICAIEHSGSFKETSGFCSLAAGTSHTRTSYPTGHVASPEMKSCCLSVVDLRTYIY